MKGNTGNLDPVHSPDPPRVLREHPHCLSCGYDLHGIPEEFCPECGVGYDHASVAELSQVESAHRDWLYPVVLSRAVLSSAGATAGFGAWHASSGGGRELVIAGLLGTGFLLHCRVPPTRPPDVLDRSFFSLWHGLGLAFLVFPMCASFPKVGAVWAIVLLANACLTLANAPRMHAESAASLAPSIQARLNRSQLLTTLSLGVAAVLTVACWFYG